MRDALPISFSRPLIPKVIDGSKDQTRRTIAGRGPDFHARARFEGIRNGVAIFGDSIPDDPCPIEVRCPHGAPGGNLWVREDHRILARDGDRVRVRYEADGAERWCTLTEHELALLGRRRSPLSKPQPGRFMYRSCSRILLQVRDLRVERLQDISEEDARAEGVERAPTGQRVYPGSGAAFVESYRAGFETVWQKINAARPGCSWDENPWVWVVGFSVAEVRR